jgi:hypothetical protein
MTVAPSPCVSPLRTLDATRETSTLRTRPSSVRKLSVDPWMFSILPWIRYHSPDGAGFAAVAVCPAAAA